MSEKNINKGIVNFVDEEHGDSIIKVVGVGGGGGNAVNHMFKEGIHKVSSKLPSLLTVDGVKMMKWPLSMTSLWRR